MALPQNVQDALAAIKSVLTDATGKDATITDLQSKNSALQTQVDGLQSDLNDAEQQILALVPTPAPATTPADQSAMPPPNDL